MGIHSRRTSLLNKDNKLPTGSWRRFISTRGGKIIVTLGVIIVILVITWQIDSKSRNSRKIAGEIKTKNIEEFTLLRDWPINSSSTEMITRLVFQNYYFGIRAKNVTYRDKNGEKKTLKTPVLIIPPRTEEGVEISEISTPRELSFNFKGIDEPKIKLS